MKYRQEEQHTFRVLADYFHLLQDWEIQYAPQSPDDEWHPLFVEALQRKTHVEYLLDNLIDGSKEEKKALVTGMRNDVAKLEQRIIVHAPERVDGDRVQEVEIHLKIIYFQKQCSGCEKGRDRLTL